jgi:hypothetical protein
MKSQSELMGYVDRLDLGGVARTVGKVALWPVLPAQSETFSRRERALQLYERLSGADGVHWEQPGRDFLHSCAKNWPEQFGRLMEG